MFNTKIPKEYFYLSPFADGIKREPVPFHKEELKKNPEWRAIQDLRHELVDTLPEDQAAFIKSTKNTFEMYDIPNPDQETIPARDQRFDMLAETFDQDTEPWTDEEFKAILIYNLLNTLEVNDEGEFFIMEPTENIMDVVGLGQKNSAHASMRMATKTYNKNANMTKSQLNPLVSIEAIQDLNDCRSKKSVTIKPFSMNAKDERVKPGKKVKQFQAANGAFSTLDAIYNGAYCDRLNARPDLGQTIGLSGNGGTLDWCTRLVFGIASGKGFLTNEELSETKVYETDYDGFEFTHPDDVRLANVGGQIAQTAGHSKGKPPNRRNEHLDILAGSLAETKLIPDVLVGGGTLPP